MLRFGGHFIDGRTVVSEASMEVQPAGVSSPPVYRIMEVRPDCWLVRRPGGSLDHQFDSAIGAEAFVRGECAGSEVIVELNIEGVQITARIIPDGPMLFRDRHT
jgi:hypothetical protein